MVSLFALILLTLAFAVYAFTSRKISLPKLGFTVLYVSLLVIAARFGARTFPGIWTPGNEVLNALTQGGIFYLAAGAALLCGLIDIAMERFPNKLQNAIPILKWTKRLMLIVSALVCAYGLFIAAILQRLP